MKIMCCTCCVGCVDYEGIPNIMKPIKQIIDHTETNSYDICILVQLTFTTLNMSSFAHASVRILVFLRRWYWIVRFFDDRWVHLGVLCVALFVSHESWVICHGDIYAEFITSYLYNYRVGPWWGCVTVKSTIHLSQSISIRNVFLRLKNQPISIFDFRFAEMDDER